jgi:predicted Zn-dependent protease
MWEKSEKVIFIEAYASNAITFKMGRLPAGQLAYRDPNTQTITINSGETYSLATSWFGRLFSLSGQYNLLTIALHELGHVICGEGHNEEHDSLMRESYFDMASKPSKRDLSRILP